MFPRPVENVEWSKRAWRKCWLVNVYWCILFPLVLCYKLFWTIKHNTVWISSGACTMSTTLCYRTGFKFRNPNQSNQALLISWCWLSTSSVSSDPHPEFVHNYVNMCTWNCDLRSKQPVARCETEIHFKQESAWFTSLFCLRVGENYEQILRI